MSNSTVIAAAEEFYWNGATGGCLSGTSPPRVDKISNSTVIAAAEEVYCAGISVGISQLPDTLEAQLSTRCISAYDSFLALDKSQPQRALHSIHQFLIHPDNPRCPGGERAVKALSDLENALMAEYNLPQPAVTARIRKKGNVAAYAAKFGGDAAGRQGEIWGVG